MKYFIFLNCIDSLSCQVLCQYYSNQHTEFLSSKLTKEIEMTSELIDFQNELIKFDNTDINDGIIYFFFVINKEVLQQNNSELSSYNRLILSEFGLRNDPIKLSFLVGEYTIFNI